MADTNFVPGTVVTSEWLNDTNAITYGLSSTASGKGAEMVAFKQSGTGAVDRTVKAKLGERISAKDYGAVGGGTNDDSAAIEAMGVELKVSGNKYADLAGLRYLTTAGVDFSNFNHVEFVGGGFITNGTELYNFPSDDHLLVS